MHFPCFQNYVIYFHKTRFLALAIKAMCVRICNENMLCHVTYVTSIDNFTLPGIKCKNFSFDVEKCLSNRICPHNLSLVATKPVFGVSYKVRFRPVCSATETS